jgi:excinuclease ABC subunit B
MYADRVTNSMEIAIKETQRRRDIQMQYNKRHGIEPRGIVKQIRDLTNQIKKVAEEQAPYMVGGSATIPIAKDDLLRMIKEIEKQMKEAAKNLEFEKAAMLRDQLVELRRTLALEDTNTLLESVSHSSNGRPKAGSARESAPTYMITPPAGVTRSTGRGKRR